MDETQWRELASLALAELPGLGLDDDTERIRAALQSALALPRGSASNALRAALTSSQRLRAWTRAQVGDEVFLPNPPRVHHPAPPPMAAPAPAAPAPATAAPEPPPPMSAPTPTDAPRRRSRLPRLPRLPRLARRRRQESLVIGGPSAPITVGSDSLDPAFLDAVLATFDDTATAAPADDDVPDQREVYPLLEAPPAVDAGATFRLTVGIAEDPTPGLLTDGHFTVPTAPFQLTVSLMMHGFETVDGSPAVRTLSVDEQHPFPRVDIDLIAVDSPTLRPGRVIRAVYAADGTTLGSATTSIAVGTAPRATPPRPVRVWPFPSDPKPDLVITIGRGNDRAQRRLEWDVQSPHEGVVLPAAPVPLDLDEGAAGEFAVRLMRGVEARVGKPDLGTYLRGAQRLVARQVPPAVWDALASVRAQVARPSVLLATTEAYVPWELAAVPASWGEGSTVLGAVVRLSRWSYPLEGSDPAPEPQLKARAIAVVKGTYAGTAALPEAEAEADGLVDEYGAVPVPADIDRVVDLLAGTPEADVIHFAVHGRLDQTGQRDGLLMNDLTPLDPLVVAGSPPRSRLVFLNACQVGQGQQLLGFYVGLAAAFIESGAQAVVAPLWKVDDLAAREFAERLYAAAFVGAEMADFFARERAQAAAAEPGTPEATVLAYLYFGHPRLTLVR